MYQHKFGVPRDYKRALAYYRSAAKQGYALGEYNLSGMFETWYAMLDLLASEKSQMKARLEKIITRETVPLDDFERGFEMVRSHQAVKLLLAPNNK